MDVDVPANANGVLYALAGFSGGVTCYVKDGFLNYEFNLFEVQRTKIKSKAKLPAGKVKIEVESKLAGAIGGPMDVTLEGEWRSGRPGPGAGRHVAPLHVERDLRHRHATWIRPCRSTTSTRRRSPSTARSARRRSRI